MGIPADVLQASAASCNMGYQPVVVSHCFSRARFAGYETKPRASLRAKATRSASHSQSEGYVTGALRAPECGRYFCSRISGGVEAPLRKTMLSVAPFLTWATRAGRKQAIQVPARCPRSGG
jgi:hypothetical protein